LDCPIECKNSRYRFYKCIKRVEKNKEPKHVRTSEGKMCDWLIGQVKEGHCDIDLGVVEKPEEFCNKCLSCVLKGEPAANKICGPLKGIGMNKHYHGCMEDQIEKLNCPKECRKSNMQAYECALGPRGDIDNYEDLHHKSPDVRNHESEHNENKFIKMLAKPVKGNK